MKAEDYLITTVRGTKTRSFVWHAQEPTAIENRQWFLEKTPMGVQATHRNTINHAASSDAAPAIKPRPLRINPEHLLAGTLLEIPVNPSEPNSTTFQISIKLLTPIRAPYLPSYTKPGLRIPNYEYYLFQGIRYFLNDLRPLGQNYRGYFEDEPIFSLSRTSSGFQILAMRNNVTFKAHGEKKIALHLGITSLVSEDKFTQGSIQWGKHWWRVNRIAVPDALPNDDLTDAFADETRWFKGISKVVTLGVVALVVAAITLPRTFKQPEVKTIPIDITKLDLKKPKLIQKKPEPKKPVPPKPPVVAKVEPKPKPPKPKPEKPKPKPPEKKVAKAKPKLPPKAAPKPVVQKKPPAPAPKVAVVKPTVQPPKAPVAKVAPPKAPVAALPPPPDPAKIAAQQRAQAQAQLTKSLSFLSPSKNRPAAAAPIDNSNQKYNTVGNAPTTPGRKSVLNATPSGDSADGPISTRAVRNMGTEVAIGGGGRGKALNDVQARVALNTLGDTGGGGDLSGTLSGKGMSMSGPGHISEAAVEKALAKHLAKFQYCYEKALLSDSTLAGTILMQWVITMDGGASEIKVVRSQLNNAALKQCLSLELGRVHFPIPTGGPATIKYPFAFTSSSL